MPEGKGALFVPEEHCIYVRKGMDAQSIFLSLSPELALAGFADGNKMYDRDAEAFHAYCASYMLCKKYVKMCIRDRPEPAYCRGKT